MTSQKKGGPGMVEAGVAKKTITPPQGVELWGYARPQSKFRSRGAYDALYVKSLVLKPSPQSTPLALIILDWGGLDGRWVQESKQLIEDKLSISCERQIFLATHTHAGPAPFAGQGIGNPDYEYLQGVKDIVVNTVKTALNNCLPVRAGFGAGEVDISLNRRQRLFDGPLDQDPGNVDPQVRVCRLEKLDGQCLALLVNFTGHPATLRRNNTKFSADYPGVMSRMVKKNFLNHPEVFFLQGAAGDIELRVRGNYRATKQMGATLAQEVLRVARGIRTHPINRVSMIHKQMTIHWQQSLPFKKNLQWGWRKLQNRWQRILLKTSLRKENPSSFMVPIQVLGIDKVYWVALPGESFVELEQILQARFPNQKFFILGYANDTRMGYIPPHQVYTQRGYEEDVAFRYYGLERPVAPETGEKMIGELAKLIRCLKKGEPQRKVKSRNFKEAKVNTGTTLALEGGSPVREDDLPQGWPGGWLIGKEEEKEVLEVIRSKSLFRHYGPQLLRKAEKFEKQYADYMGTKHALGVSSGTAALIVGLTALGIGPGDEVILPAYNFVASAAAIIAVKAVPVFCEVDDTLTMDPEDLEKRITAHTKAIMPIHMRGAPGDIKRICEIARKHNLLVLEDYSQANGASFRGKKVGTFGDIGAASLQYHKVITTGDGGILVTNNSQLHDRIVRISDQGARRADEIDGMDPSQLIIGQNFRMNELTAAVGIAQLHKIDRIIDSMLSSKKRIKKAISDIKGITFRRLTDHYGDTGATLIFYLDGEELAKKFHRALNAEGITNNLAYYSGQHVYAHFQQLREKRQLSKIKCPWDCPFYQGKIEPPQPGDFPQTDNFLKRAIHIDLVPIFSHQDEQDIVEGIRKVSRAYGV